MHAVAGVSGHTGAVVADELLRRGKPVRVIVRSSEKGRPWAERGAEVAVASLEDEAALEKAFQGCEGAYVLVPPDMATTDMEERGKRIGRAMARAAKSSGIRHLVFLSSLGAQHAAGTGPVRSLHQAERELRAAGVNLTILRPTFFLENWVPSLGAARTDGVLPSFIQPSLRFPMVATRDIGVMAADALLDPPSGTRILEIAGPEDYSPEEVASAAGSVLGKEVHAVPAPLEAVVPTFTSFGASEHLATLYREMFEGINSGHMAWDGAGERRRGTTTPREVFANVLQA